MRADDDKLAMQAYVDGELDLASQLALEDRLRADAALQARIGGLRTLSHTLRDGAEYHAAPSHLRARVLPANPPTQPRAGRSGRRAAVLSGLLAWRPLASGLAVAAIAAVAFNLAVLHTGELNRAREDLVASHVRAMLSQRAIDVASSDQHTVKPWFAGQLDFSPPVKQLDLPGTELLGGRVDYVQGRKAAVVVYQYRKHIVDHYMWPATGGPSAVETIEVRGFRVAQWTQGGMEQRIVSDMSDDELQAFVQACREAQKG